MQLHQYGPVAFNCGDDGGHAAALGTLFNVVQQLLRDDHESASGPLDVLRSLIMSYAIHPGDGYGDETLCTVFAGNAAILVSRSPMAVLEGGRSILRPILWFIDSRDIITVYPAARALATCGATPVSGTSARGMPADIPPCYSKLMAEWLIPTTDKNRQLICNFMSFSG